MSFWVLLQVLANLLFLAGIAVLWIKLHRPPKDDPRLSRGLQILQSKISVLEDLSDRTDTQSNQLIALMEQKIKELQAQILKSETQISRIDQSMGKSLEVAKIFQDKIPHQEIIERQNTVKYVQAARLAHRGLSIDEIATKVDLSRSEIELISKVNRDRLQFSEAELPEWAKDEFESDSSADFVKAQERFSLEKPVSLRLEEQRSGEAQAMSLSSLGDRFRQATQSAPAEPVRTEVSRAKPKAPEAPAIRKVVFPKVEVNSNLG